MEMEMKKVLLTMVVFGSLMQTAIGAVYTPGDLAGWTTIGNVNYKQWAATKTFKLGDTIVFRYNKQFHNVMQVNHADYRSCNISTPISTHSTGNDSIIIKTYGHRFYLCAVPGHCQAGQKLDINVQKLSSTMAPSIPPPLASISSPSSSTPASDIVNKPNSSSESASLTISVIIIGLMIAVFVGIV